MKLEHVLATKGRDLYTIEPDVPLLQAAGMLADHNIGALVVVDGAKQPAGIVSERDIIRAAADGMDLGLTPVRDVMTTETVTGTPGDDVEPVLRMMTAGHFRHLPIVEDGKLTGIVTLGDLVKHSLTEYIGALQTREAQMMDQPGA